jgi:hypothetical protein
MDEIGWRFQFFRPLIDHESPANRPQIDYESSTNRPLIAHNRPLIVHNRPLIAYTAPIFFVIRFGLPTYKL